MVMLCTGGTLRKRCGRAGYSAWEILRGSEERAMGIFDLLGKLGHEKQETESVRPEN